ncbi:MAG: recombinase family protein, partial [archaeon]
MKALIYRRISTNDTKQDIDRQKEPLLKFCENKGMEVIAEFRDAITGSTQAASREGYSKLLDYVNNFKGNKTTLNVVFDEVSRLGRKKIDILTECDKFTKQGLN